VSSMAFMPIFNFIHNKKAPAVLFFTQKQAIKSAATLLNFLTYQLHLFYVIAQLYLDVYPARFAPYFVKSSTNLGRTNAALCKRGL
jgi:hypothetical protein